MIYRPIGKLVGNTPFDRDDVTGPNDSTPAVPQPDGTKLLADGEGYNARQWNRALAAIGEEFDLMVSAAIDTNECSMEAHVVSVGIGASQSQEQLPGWAFIGDGAAGTPTTPPASFLFAILKTTGSDAGLYLDSDGAPCYVESFAEGVINDGTSKAVSNVLPITTAYQYGLECGSDLELGSGVNDPVIPGHWCFVSGSDGNAYDGYYLVTDVRYNKVDLVHFRHRLYMSGMAVGSWAVGDDVQNAAGTITGVIVASNQPNGWIEVEITSRPSHNFDASVGVADDIEDLSNPDFATLDTYHKPGDPVLLDTTAFGAATMRIYAHPNLYYQPTLNFSVDLEGGAAGADYAIYYHKPNAFGSVTPAMASAEAILASALRDILALMQQDLHGERIELMPSMHIGYGGITPDKWNLPPPNPDASITFDGIVGGQLQIDTAGVNFFFIFDPLTGTRYDVTYPGGGLTIGEQVNLGVGGPRVGDLYTAFQIMSTAGNTDLVRVVLDDGIIRPAVGQVLEGDSSGNTATIDVVYDDQDPPWFAFTEGRYCRGWYAAEGDPKTYHTLAAPADGEYALYMRAQHVADPATDLGKFGAGIGYYAYLDTVRTDTMTRAERRELVETYLVLCRFTIAAGSMTLISWTDMNWRSWPHSQTAILDYADPFSDGDDLKVGPLANVGPAVMASYSGDEAYIKGSDDATYGDNRRFRPSVMMLPYPPDEGENPWGCVVAGDVDPSDAYDVVSTITNKALYGVLPGGGDRVVLLVLETAGGAMAPGDVLTGGTSGAVGRCDEIQSYLGNRQFLSVDIASSSTQFDTGEEIDDGGAKTAIIVDIYRPSFGWTCTPEGGTFFGDVDGDMALFQPGYRRGFSFGNHRRGILRIPVEFRVDSDESGWFPSYLSISRVGGGFSGLLVEYNANYIDVAPDNGLGALVSGDVITGTEVGDDRVVVIAHVNDNPYWITESGVWAYKGDRDSRYPAVIGNIYKDGGLQYRVSGLEGTVERPLFSFSDVSLRDGKLVRRPIPLSSLLIDSSWTDIAVASTSPGRMGAAGSAESPVQTAPTISLTNLADTVDRAAFGLDLPEGVFITNAGIQYVVDVDDLADMELMLLVGETAAGGPQKYHVQASTEVGSGSFAPSLNLLETDGLAFSSPLRPGAPGTSGYATHFVFKIDADITAFAMPSVGAGSLIDNSPAHTWTGLIVEHSAPVAGTTWLRVALVSPDPTAYPNPAGEPVAIGVHACNIVAGSVYDPPPPFDRAAAPDFRLAADSGSSGLLVSPDRQYYLVPHPIHGPEHGGAPAVHIFGLWVEYAVCDLRC